MDIEYFKAFVRPPPHALDAVHECYPKIFSGRGGVVAREAALSLWLYLDDERINRSRLNYCTIAYGGRRRREVARDVWSVILESTWSRGYVGSVLTAIPVITRKDEIKYYRPFTYRELADMFALADPRYLMGADERAALAALPNEIVVYRGVSGIPVGKARRGMSWTVEKASGAWFANKGRGEPLCVKALVKKSNVLAYFDRESEIIVPSGRVLKVVQVPIVKAEGVAWDDRDQLLP